MVAFYIARIRADKITLEQVPPKWHDTVAAEMGRK